MAINNWNAYPDFKKAEFECTHCGQCDMHQDLLSALQGIRDYIDEPMIINSGYRCENHPVEAKKDSPGEHTYGLAADVACFGKKAQDILYKALQLGITRIGINQKNNFGSRYIHLGIADKKTNLFPSGIWTY